jgi:hypothetical protein
VGWSSRLCVRLQLSLELPDKCSESRSYCDIVAVRALDYIASDRPAAVSAPGNNGLPSTISVEYDGSVFSRSGVAFLWSLPGTQSEASLTVHDGVNRVASGPFLRLGNGWLC